MIAPAHPPKHRLPPRRSLIKRPEPNPNSTNTELNHAQRIIGNHPVIAVAVAGLIGIAIGCLVKRREL